ncbi:MAG: hypothetical protein JWQ01_2167 [Massilia sp.]|nr:hypothetical protein [Massilia sp.]
MVHVRWHAALFAGSVILALGAAASAQETPDGRPAAAAAAPQSEAERKARSSVRDAQADSHTPLPAQGAEPQHFRGQIVRVDNPSFVLKTKDGKTVRIAVTDATTTISLSKGSFSNVDFGTYVGAVAVKLDEYSPIVRDSAVWLHRGYELRIIDEELRGIALGHRKWDLTRDSIISQGWVDDIETRVLSIKWGPTDYDETDVEVPRDVPVLRMSLGDKSLITNGAHVMVGANKLADGKFEAAFIFVGKDGIVPPL